MKTLGLKMKLMTTALAALMAVAITANGETNRQTLLRSRLLAQEATWKNRPIRHFRTRGQFMKFVRGIPIRRSGMSERDYWDRWQAALWAPTFDKVSLALKILHWLDGEVQAEVEQDQIDLALARTYFQQPNLQKAIQHYRKVPSDSDSWLEAQEEMAWTYLRLNQHNKTISALATVTSPVFSRVIRAEPYFLKSLTHLQICDYKGVFKTTQVFKKNFGKRAPALQQLVDQGSSPAAEAAIDLLKYSPLKMTSVGKQAPQLPSLFWRDQFFQRHILNWRRTNRGTYRQSAMKRLRDLARQDVAEISGMIQKMHIVEAEVIQRLHMDVHLTDTKVKQQNQKDSKDKLYFPYTSEVWLDELDSYQAKVKDCPTLRKASL